jgi:plastocyanin
MKEIDLGISILALAATIVMIIIPSIASTPAQSTESSAAVGGITNPTTAASSSNKTFYIFVAEHEGVNETKLGIPPDAFSPDILAVNTGDNVTVHFYNTDPTERHTFTMRPPYNIDKDLEGGQNATAMFKAGEEGVYRFFCKYHQPTMAGQLIVLPPPVVEKTTNTSISTTTK